jgi:hypothetical protein
MHHSNTTLFQNEYHFILLHVSIHNKSLSGICTKHLNHSISLSFSFYFLLTLSKHLLSYRSILQCDIAHANCSCYLQGHASCTLFFSLWQYVLLSLNWLFISFHSHFISVLYYIDLSIQIHPI